MIEEGEPDDAHETAPDDDRDPRRPLAPIYMLVPEYRGNLVGQMTRKVFPFDTAAVLERLTGAQARMIGRWLRGVSRMPKPLIGRIAEQERLQEAFGRELDELVARHFAEGLLPEAARQRLLGIVQDVSEKSSGKL